MGLPFGLMSKNRFLKPEHGLSVVELMIVLSLLSIVLAIGYLYFGFGAQAFERGERLSIAQQSSRLASIFITREIRFANEIIINPAESGFAGGYRYIFLENESIKFRDESGSTKVLADSEADGFDYYIFFTSNVPYDVVYFYIFADFPDDIDISDYITIDQENDIWEFEEENLEADGGKGLYFLKTKVQALNLELFNIYGQEEELIKLNGIGGNTIKYKVP